MVKILTVYDTDPAFGKQPADYANQKEKIPFTTTASSSLDRLVKYGEDHLIEILLVDESSRVLAGDVRAEQVIVLRDGAPVDGPDIFPAICRYQSGDCIMHEILVSYYSRPAEPTLALLGFEALVVRIYSPMNRCFESSLALAIGQVMAEKESMLYLNLEEYSGFIRLIDSKYKADLSDILHLYRQGGHNRMELKSVVSNWGNMDFIPSVRYAEDLNQVTSEGMAQLINRIVRESSYSRLVVDVGQMGKGALPVLSMYNAVYISVRKDYISAAKIEESEGCLEEVDDTGVRDRIQELRPLRHAGIVKQEGYLEQLIQGEMGDFVRQLLNGKQPERWGMEGEGVRRESQK